MEFRNADTKSETGVDPSPPFVRRAENMTNERKYATRALDWIYWDLGSKLIRTKKGGYKTK